jgi:DNA repair exonuclease SbcCD ATPase subunit
MCYDKAFIDFTQFSAALLVGKAENNELIANGVGKTTIFKAIEYVLFNHADINLEKIIRDDSASCKIVFDFLIGDQEYRIARTRTKKGSTNLVLLERNGTPGTEEEVYYSATEEPWIDKKVTEKFWKNLSGSRSGDTEKDLAKLVKINYKSFRSTYHFVQNDLSGLSTVTAEKRKGILKEPLNLIIYTKLCQMAKDKANVISKEIERHKTLLETLGDPDKELLELAKQLVSVEQSLNEKGAVLADCQSEIEGYTQKVNELTTAHANIESKFASLLANERQLTADRSKLETSVKEYQSKKSNVIKSANELVGEIKSLKDNQVKLATIDYSQIDILNEEVEKKKEIVTQHNVNIRTNLADTEKLKVPFPDESYCDRCRQPMTDKHRKEEKTRIANEMKVCQANIQEAKKNIAALNAEITTHLQTINSLKLSKKQLEDVNTQITAKTKELQDKGALHDEYKELHAKFTAELTDKIKELEEVSNLLKDSSLDEAKLLKEQIQVEKQKIAAVMTTVTTLNKEINHFNNNKAVIQNNIDQKTKNKAKKNELTKSLVDLEEKFVVYPSVVQAFSTTGIPNLIIQNVLDDLQVEANNLLSQLKPGLQLSFSVEKTVEKTGDQADTLDINYTVNGRERYYEQLSGAMKLAVSFALKLGLSFLLQKMLDVNVQLLLLDEIDQSLDKASIDAFADIIKFFQKDYNILVITHNDRLKDKFSHAILVEQDTNMVSKARVVSSW